MRPALLIIVLCAAITVVSACDGNEQKGDKPDNTPENTAAQSAIPAGQLPDTVTPLHYDLELTIDPGQAHFNGRSNIKITVNRATDHIWLHGAGLDVHRAALSFADGSAVEGRYEQRSQAGVARVLFPVTVEAGDAELSFDYTAPYSQTSSGLYKVVDAGEAYAFSQFEAIDARRAFPGFDEPRFKTPFDVAVIAHKDHAVIANGAEISREELEDGMVRRIFGTTKPLPTYLIAFAVGPLDVVAHEPVPATDIRRQPLALRGVAVQGKGSQLGYALENTAAILTELENYFGTPYPYQKLDIIAVPEFAFGAMENAGAITYRETLLLFPESAALARRARYGAVHAHEIAHQWFGNLVTPVWWDDIWLNESFASWMAYRAAHQWWPDIGYDRTLVKEALGAMTVDSSASARQIRQPIESNDDIPNAFDSITYDKGGAVLSMFENYTGEAAFRDGIRLHMERFAHGNATVDGFLESLSEGSGRPEIADAFRSFLMQPGVPMIDVSLQCESGGSSLSLEQSRYAPLGADYETGRLWQVPVCVSTDQGQQCHLMKEARETLDLGSHCPAYVMPNAKGRGYYRFSLDDGAWRALLDNFSELTSAEALAMADSMRAGFEAGTLSAEALLNAYRIIAGHDTYDVAARPIDSLYEFQRHLLSGKQRDNFRAYVSSLYGERLSELGLRADTAADKRAPSNTRMLRKELVFAMAILAGNQDLRADLTKMAKAYLGEPGEPLNPAAANPDILDILLRVAVEDEGVQMAELVLDKMLKSREADFRMKALYALSGAKDDAFTERMFALMLSDEIRHNEADGLADYYNAWSDAPAYAQFWQWFTANFHTFAARFSTFSGDRLIKLANQHCSPDSRDAAAAFLAENAGTIVGAPRMIKLTLEEIEQCIALREAKGDEFNAALSVKAASGEG